MRVLQLIDSLEAGGAERMAVNYANTLADEISFSALVTTRKEGTLKDQLSDKVVYSFLNKKSKWHGKAILRLRSFIKQNKITIIHAHSTSFFTAILVKVISPKIKIVWHDHYGDSEYLEKRESFVLKSCASFFHGIISVNSKLMEWASKELRCSKVIYLPNFIFFKENNSILKHTLLEGINGKRIVCLANLRAQKNHFMLLKVAKLLKKSQPDWSFHLVGKDFQDDYSNSLKAEIINRKLEKNVFIYDSRNDIEFILNQSEIAILTSKSEGLPVALLEYGFYEKAVFTTNVGDVKLVIKNDTNGVLIDSEDVEGFYSELVGLIKDPDKRSKLSAKLYQEVMTNYSDKAVIKKYLGWLEKI